jgi:predicted glycogen debranching enzyme
MTDPARRQLRWAADAAPDVDALLDREWLVSNGLGGYASGTVAGVMTRRYHGYLVAALSAPLGRVVMLQQLAASLHAAGGATIPLDGEHRAARGPHVPGARHLREFRLEMGLPVWEYEAAGMRIEKRVVMPHQQNTVMVVYRILGSRGGEPVGVEFELRPAVHIRSYEAPVTAPHELPYRLVVEDDRFEIHTASTYPPMRFAMRGTGKGTAQAAGGADDESIIPFTVDRQRVREVLYRVEEHRGYGAIGDVWSPGVFRARLTADDPVVFIASTEPWAMLEGLDADASLAAERGRRSRLVALAGTAVQDPIAAELVLAADQFIITPVGRAEDAARARAEGDEARTVIAGYHWFTDWGRDTMISLEGLTLVTGRHREAASILRTFAHHVRDGLIPNMFPDGSTEGLYHTADATLWFFHALRRYVSVTGDRSILEYMLPILEDIVEHHLRGTRFGIGVDPTDGLLRQGAAGYQLTWMDAKVDDWVVTPRRGKAVEINALWYNALRLLEGWLHDAGGDARARRLADHAERARTSFNQRFWFEPGGHLYDVIDTDAGPDDAACRPNQLLAISLDHPVLDVSRWSSVLEAVRLDLLTPVGLRSLSPRHVDYKPRYFGDLRARDAAYHQGTVWGWLIGPWIDAWLAVHPQDRIHARRFLDGLVAHLDHFGVGSIAEIFDAETPYTARGCIAQAWSVAEMLRCWVRTAP